MCCCPLGNLLCSKIGLGFFCFGFKTGLLFVILGAPPLPGEAPCVVPKLHAFLSEYKIWGWPTLNWHIIPNPAGPHLGGLASITQESSSLFNQETETGYGIMEEPDLTLVSTSDISITETDLANLTLEDRENNEASFQVNAFTGCS